MIRVLRNTENPEKSGGAGGIPGTVQADGNRRGILTGIANVIKLTHLTEKDRVLIITDRKTEGLARMLEKDVQKRWPEGIKLILMEEYGSRPMTALPEKMLEEIKSFRPTLSYFIGTGLEGELGFRKPMREALMQLGARHAHMIGFDESIAGGEAMCADYDKIYEITHKVHEIVKDAKKIRVTHANGTDITVDLDPEKRSWKISDGVIDKQGMFHNLPDGEVFTAPMSVNGFYATNSLGDHFSARHGILKQPLTVRIENNRAVGISCKDPVIEAEVAEYLGLNGHRRENADMVGEFAIGTNIFITYLIGNMLSDEKAVGVHIAFGSAYPETFRQGKPWDVYGNQHCDMVLQGCTVQVDGRTIMEDGKFII